MQIGQRVTVVFRHGKPFEFLRCYVVRAVSDGWQLYDPVRDWSWGLEFDQVGRRVIFI